MTRGEAKANRGLRYSSSEGGGGGGSVDAVQVRSMWRMRAELVHGQAICTMRRIGTEETRYEPAISVQFRNLVQQKRVFICQIKQSSSSFLAAMRTR